jgi:branched-chain amino acid transport system ATP-binding protein
VLEVRGLSKSFAGFRAVSDVDLAVAEGEIAAVIGPNGAGKSTLFSLITGHLRPTAGSVFVNGRDITGVAPHKICGMGLGRSFQRTNIFPKLTVLENVRAALLAHRGQGPNFWSHAKALCHSEAEVLLASIGLAAQARATAGTLSYGNQKQLELGIALASDPKILLLDEPTAGMSASETHETMALIERIARERRLTLLFTEHDMAVVFSIAHRIAVMHQGRLIAHGDPTAVRADAQVRRIYLGDEPMGPRR